MLGKIKFRAPDKTKTSDISFIDDYYASEKIGRARLGKLNLYYRDLGKKYYVPYDYIDNAFVRVCECVENEFGNSDEYYKLVLVHNKKEFANLLFQKIAETDQVLDGIKTMNPNVKIGYEKK